MAVKLNLLPPEYTSTKGLGSVLKVTRALGIISIAVFLVFTLGVSAFYLISSASLRSLNSDIDALKGQIGSLEKSEQQIVLLKDRLLKIKNILGITEATSNVTNVRPYISNIAGGSLRELNVDADKANFSLNFVSNRDVSNYLSLLSENKEFKTITLKSFTYSSANGYQTDFVASVK